MIRSAFGQRAVGLILVTICVWSTVDEWKSAIYEGFYHPKYSVLFPCLAVAGLGLLLFPMDYERLKAEHGVDRPQSFWHLTPLWQIWLFLAIIVALGNWYAIAHWR